MKKIILLSLLLVATACKEQTNEKNSVICLSEKTKNSMYMTIAKNMDVFEFMFNTGNQDFEDSFKCVVGNPICNSKYQSMMNIRKIEDIELSEIRPIDKKYQTMKDGVLCRAKLKIKANNHGYTNMVVEMCFYAKKNGSEYITESMWTEKQQRDVEKFIDEHPELAQ